MDRETSYRSWGSNIDSEAHKQMANACRLPVSVAGALMPDAHVGYGLPIGGVLATDNAVIPYAVGVDIACRVKLSVFDIPEDYFRRHRQDYQRILKDNTSFGIGASWKKPKQHEVLDEDWSITPFVSKLKDLAVKQLGTSGSGNHFVEFGILQMESELPGLSKGRYTALVSHSGSRGPGSKIADHYSRLARSLHPELPKELAHLSWLDMNAEGAEYWQAMELMGRFASANHDLIHRDIAKAMKEKPLFQVENHHNFAWKEEHEGREVIVHRKGATPASKGELGYIPGTMIHSGYLVQGKGNAASMNSSAHGAGRAMSRKAAKSTTTRNALKNVLAESGVDLISAGLDESPHAYKNIEQVMQEQNELVSVIARFQPVIVIMAPDGERAED